MQSGCKAGGLVSCWAAKEAGWRGVEEPGVLLRSQGGGLLQSQVAMNSGC